MFSSESGASLFKDPNQASHFFAEYYGKQLYHSATAGKWIRKVLSWNDLSLILSTHMFTPAVCRFVQDREYVNPARYLRTPQLHLIAEEVERLLESGATLVLDNVELMLPELRTLLRFLETQKMCSAHINLYATATITEAFGAHTDDQHALVCQLEGRKHWTVWDGADSSGGFQEARTPVFEGYLEEGEWLHIPRGWWHAVRSSEVPSLHITVGMTPYTLADYAIWLVEQDATLASISVDDIISGDVDTECLQRKASTWLVPSPDQVGTFVSDRRGRRTLVPNINVGGNEI